MVLEVNHSYDMENINFPKGFKVYLPLLVLFLLLVFMMPRDPKFYADYEKGSPWMYETLVTQFDFPVLKTAEQLQSTTMDPNKRLLRQITIENAAEAERTFSMLMGDDVPPRREFIEQNAHYANIDA